MTKPRTMALVLLLAVMLGAAGVNGAPADKTQNREEFPLRITSTRLEADQKEGLILFSGKVKADYRDATLYSEQLRVYFKPQTGAARPKAATPAPGDANQGPLGDLGGQKIDRIVAKGNVRLVQGDRVATGDEAIYYKDRDEVVLRGNPQLWRAENTLKGERIVFHLNTNRVVVESSPQKRVEALLYSQTPAGGKEGKELLPLGPKARKGRQH